MNKKNNPFNITRAIDFSDEEIIKYWVDIASGDGFNQTVKPTSQTPILILGGKGSGKTHIMRYYSYELQRIRYEENLVEGIIDDGYLGVYQRCGGLNSSRFSGKGQTEEAWHAVFSYYIELWFAQIVLGVLKDLERHSELIDDEMSMCQSIVELFDEKITDKQDLKIGGICNILKSLQKKVDSIVNNAALNKRLDNLKILTTSGRLIFGIPQIIVDHIPSFKKVQFLYLIDEFENLTEQQQKLYNTLLREIEAPSTFRIGARLYGIKTRETFSADEENKEGSEFEIFKLDGYFRQLTESKQIGCSPYGIFTKKLCAKRLSESGYSIPHGSESESVVENLSNFFENLNMEEYCAKLLRKKKEAPYFKKVRNKLKGSDKSVVDKIISNLSVPENPIIERTNVFLFYREWNKDKEDLVKHSLEVQKDCIKYLNDSSRDTRHFIVLDKFKNDIIAQLILECGGNQYYAGLESFITMSAGIPRVLLNILKHIYRWSSFYGESPFEGGLISVESQRKGVQDACEWFFEDAKPGKEGAEVKNSIIRLGQFMREIRYSDIPPECSITAFCVNMTELKSETSDLIELAEQYSYLIGAGVRHEKNSKRLDPIFKLNGILAPKWDLPIYKRGEIKLSKLEAEVIFTSSFESEFQLVLKKRLSNYNAPFGKKNKSVTESLFQGI